MENSFKPALPISVVVRNHGTDTEKVTLFNYALLSHPVVKHPETIVIESVTPNHTYPELCFDIAVKRRGIGRIYMHACVQCSSAPFSLLPEQILEKVMRQTVKYKNDDDIFVMEDIVYHPIFNELNRDLAISSTNFFLGALTSIHFKIPPNSCISMDLYPSAMDKKNLS